MRILAPIFLATILFLGACNTPQHVLIRDSNGNIVRDLTSSTALSGATKTENAIWLLIVLVGGLYILWKEFGPRIMTFLGRNNATKPAKQDPGPEQP